MKINLAVIQQFADFKIGDRITDPALVENYLASHPLFVVKYLVPEAPVADQPAPPDQK